MAVKHAKTLDDQQFEKLLHRLTKDTKRPKVEKVAFLLSYKSGLRVQEIAGLQWEKNLLDVEGNLRTEEYIVAGSKGRAKKVRHPVIFIGSDIGKYGHERTIRMHDMLRDAIIDLREEGLPGPWLLPSGRNGAEQGVKSRAHALKMRINRFYNAMGYDGCSSHSGRRTFITKAARAANFANCSLVDVQQMAGHRQLTTTQNYIDTSSMQADLIGLI